MTGVAPTRCPELQYFLGETLHALADDMARQLGPRLLLGMPVTEIRHGPDGVAGNGARAILRGRARHHCRSAGDGLAHPLCAGAARAIVADARRVGERRRHQDPSCATSAPSGATAA